MWLMYPIDSDDVRSARRGVRLVFAASALWYAAFAAVTAVGSRPVLDKVYGKFEELPEPADGVSPSTLPLLALLAAWALSGGLRLLGYRMTRTIAGALGTPESVALASVGAVVSVATVVTIKFGVTGLLAMVAVGGAVLELRFLRLPATLFGMVVSADAVRWVHRYFSLRAAWLTLLVPPALMMLVAHILTDIPYNEGGPYQHAVRTVNGLLYPAFRLFALAALAAMPLVAAAYWALLYRLHQALPRILDPNGPTVSLPPPTKPGFDQLKQVLQPQDW